MSSNGLARHWWSGRGNAFSGRPRGTYNRCNRERNARIIEMRRRGLTFGQIGLRLKVSRTTVSGVVWRWLEANWAEMAGSE